jgi:uncharacterized protein (TIGR00730 family)
VKIQSVCVYCGSSLRVAKVYREAASRFGTLMAEAGVQIVYGGGRVGLMGLMADAAVEAGGRVIGVIPSFLEQREVGHQGLSELRIVDSMHSRKAIMAELSDAFVVLPGGLGTLDEAFEILTWRQLQLHDKPIVLVDVNGFWQPLIELIDSIVDSGFARPENRGLFTVVGSPEEVLRALAEEREPHLAPAPMKWM